MVLIENICILCYYIIVRNISQPYFFRKEHKSWKRTDQTKLTFLPSAGVWDTVTKYRLYLSKENIWKSGQSLTYITRLFDKDFNQLDFLRWKGYSCTEAVISACKELYANPVFKNKLKETAQFRIELLDGTTVYYSDNSIFIKKRSAKKPARAVAEESKYTSK